jgi:twitching motility protein PilT
MSEKVTYLINSKEYYIDPDFNIIHKNKEIDIDKLLSAMLINRASDLHIKAPTGPVYRIDGELNKNDCFEVTPTDVEYIFFQIATDTQRSEFYLHNEVDFAYAIPGVARFRVNVHRQRGTLGIVFRVIPFKIPSERAMSEGKLPLL